MFISLERSQRNVQLCIYPGNLIFIKIQQQENAKMSEPNPMNCSMVRLSLGMFVV